MKRKIIKTCIILFVIAVMGILLSPVISMFFSLFSDIGYVYLLEHRLCSQKNYEQVAKDLALICSNIESDSRTSQTEIMLWPDSVRKLRPIRGYLSSDGASVLFTCGFTHLSYRLEKVPNDDNNSNKWELSFDDEGRSKYLTTIELSGNESFNFDIMFQKAAKKHELLLNENPDSAQLKQQKDDFLSLFGIPKSDDSIATNKEITLPGIPEGFQLQENQNPEQTFIVKVISVTDIGLRSALCYVEFEITQGPSAGQGILSLYSSGEGIDRTLGSKEDWWWDFVYRKAEFKGNNSFKLTCKQTDMIEKTRNSYRHPSNHIPSKSKLNKPLKDMEIISILKTQQPSVLID